MQSTKDLRTVSISRPLSQASVKSTVETNIRIFNYGTELFIDARRASVTGHFISPKILQKICNSLRFSHGKVAVLVNQAGVPELLILSASPFESLEVKNEDEDWRVIVSDTGQVRRLQFESVKDVWLMADLVQRHLLVQLDKRSDLWRVDSPRIFCDDEPFQVEDGICAYRRYHISVIPVEGKGLGVVTHISTSFFTADTVADFFRTDLPDTERHSLRKRFERLTLRQAEQKGTLLYDLGRSQRKCYFDRFLEGVTCATTDKLLVKGKSYDSLLNYYLEEHPHVDVKAEDLVARVSFKGLPRPVPVAAHLLRVRVMNQALPNSLKQVDKISPEERAWLADKLWSKLPQKILGKGMRNGLWRPDESIVVRLEPPPLKFGGEKVLYAPSQRSIVAYQQYYRRRLEYLNKYGCYNVPPAMQRQIHFAVPKCVPEDAAQRLASDLVARLQRWTRINTLSWDVTCYSDIDDAAKQLEEKPPGVVIFVFEDREPSTYFLISYTLKSWRVKRITWYEMRWRYKRLTQAERLPKPARNRKDLSKWQPFVEMSALDVLQLLDCVPWVVARRLNYDAQLTIDVGAKKRFFGLSVLINRPNGSKPAFALRSLVEHKPDTKRETIDKGILYDKILELFQLLPHRQFDPLDSLLVLRDGHEYGDEMEAIEDARKQLIQRGFLTDEAVVHVIDLLKSSEKDIRLWEDESNTRSNVLEGNALLLSKDKIVVATTGAATLTLGTANPVTLQSSDPSVNLVAAASDMFATSQLNWSNPRKAQRLPLSSKQTDDDLKDRAAQEIRLK
jgi:hypothetical protein